ncbi:hypothetical protein [Bacteroides sp. 224]|uniref:hypothetical protein n=1 Tax=Bacteroides sp. 224 TaxID=2302936 RepID=UPI0013D7EEE1|nr:hypothetical protein [Bacteroides sp. 224]NDV67042.1 hypothetical protein [Bacteroides sp. 224]
MKNLVLMTVAVFCLTACGNKKAEQGTQVPVEETAKANDVASYKLDQLLTEAEQLIDKTVTVRGFVTHTCKHSGKRCFIIGDDQKTTMRIEAKGEIGGFNRELIGSELAITGVLKERRLSKEYLEQYEKDVNDKKAKEDGSAETCEAELSNIQGMRDWMKEHNKDYYSTYYMDGERYDIVE